MPSLEKQLASPATWAVTADATNAIATATKAAVAGSSHYITGASWSTSAAPTAATTVELRDGATVLAKFQVPAALQAPILIHFPRPYLGTSGNAVSLVVGALGVAVIGTANISGFSVVT